MRAKVIVLENTPLNAVHEWQHNRLNHQTDVQICSQGAGDNHESAPAVIGNCSTDHNSRCRSSVSRPQTGWMQASPGLLLVAYMCFSRIRNYNNSSVRQQMASLKLRSELWTPYLYLNFLVTLLNCILYSVPFVCMCRDVLRLINFIISQKAVLWFPLSGQKCIK
ncbi:hypothetical protein AVEN_81584-1 [Araneus ventricosus]|uniref:Uncharacterized protein n=1 Tax=Araneus ventricosus TaxID=182803 RepID=A0A4Y2FQI9_ARAVE|nr:hypothetical protein AVEN_81584-1 [Araneus ventricosus]